jgi:hypothetical protein
MSFAEDRFEPTHRIVRQITHGASTEWNQPGSSRELALTKMLAHEVDGPHVDLPGHPVGFDLRYLSAPSDNHFRVRAQKGVTGEALAALHGFQKERVLRMSCNTQEGAHGCLKVGKNSSGNRHHVAALRFAQKILKCSRLYVEHRIFQSA